jgi:thymidylate synthase
MYNTHHIKVNTIPDAWFQCIYDIFDEEKNLIDIRKIDKGSFAGCLRREFKSILIEIENPCDPDLNKRIPQIPESKIGIPNPIDAIIYPEIKCEICGEDIISFKIKENKYFSHPCGHEVTKNFYEIAKPSLESTVIKYFGDYLFSDKLSKNEQYTYGARILEKVEVPLFIEGIKNPIASELELNFSEYIEKGCENTLVVPQYYYLCAYLKTNPNSNQIILQIGKPSDVVLPDPPCLRELDFRVRDGKLDWFIYFRSNDLWGGFPLNMAGLSMLMDQMCVDSNLEPGKFIYHSKGLHLYEYSWSSALARLGRSIKDLEINNE